MVIMGKVKGLTAGIVLPLLLLMCTSPKQEEEGEGRVIYDPDTFVMGADLSYLNEILDHGGTYLDSGRIKDPFAIFAGYGTNVARFRLFYNPQWTREKYGPSGTQMYQDFSDTRNGMKRARMKGMKLCLDFHYSDTWADPGHQKIPSAWEGLNFAVLQDSLYHYTLNTLLKLEQEGLMPDYIQTGNEINPGFLLPVGNRWENTGDFITLINAAIQAVRDAGDSTGTNPKVILHVAQPANALKWFDGLFDAGLDDFDIIGISYYYLWSDVPLANVSNYLSVMTRDYGKPVMIMETAYPWTTSNADSYSNIIDTTQLPAGYPPTPDGQLAYLVKLTQEVIDGGGIGLFYWEPGWITSGLVTQWGTGSAWDCNTLFDFAGEVLPGMKYMTRAYDF